MRNKSLRHSLLGSSALLVFATLPLASCNSGIANYATVRLDVSSLEMNVGEAKQIKVSVSKGYWRSSLVLKQRKHCFDA